MEKLKTMNFFAALSLYASAETEEELPTTASSGSNQTSKATTTTKKKKKMMMKKGERGGSENTDVIITSPLPAQPKQSEALQTSLRWPLVWIDLEMTGLDVEKDRILEIACIITDGKLTQIIEGPDLIINQPEELLSGMGEWCQAHHTASGLVEGVRKSQVTEEEAEKQVLDFVCQHTGPMQPQIAGNSVYVDLMFLQKYMPKLAASFSHIIVDVSSIKALCYRWFPKDAERAPIKKKQHRALEDIKESIEELKYLKKAIFKENRK